MFVVVVLVTVLLSMAAMFALIRIVRGPELLDRVVAVEVLIPTVMSAVGVEAAVSQRTVTFPILVVVAIVGFVGSVTVVQLMGLRR